MRIRRGRRFIRLIERNLERLENKVQFGDYEEDDVIMVYDSVVIKKNGELTE